MFNKLTARMTRNKVWYIHSHIRHEQTTDQMQFAFYTKSNLRTLSVQNEGIEPGLLIQSVITYPFSERIFFSETRFIVPRDDVTFVSTL